MSESTVESGEQQPQEGGEQQKPESKTFDAEYVDKLRKESARYRTEAKANAEAAAELAKIQDSQKSEAEKAAERVSKAEAEVASIPSRVAEALREHLVTLHEIDKDDAELFLTANEPDLLLKQVTRLVGQSETRRKNNNHVPTEGRISPSAPDDEREAVRSLFGSD